MSRTFAPIQTVFDLFKDTLQAWQQDKAAQVAAALAYYTVFSLTPLSIVAIAIAGSIFGEDAARGEIIGQIEGLVGTSAAELIENAIENANRPDLKNIASWLSLGVLLLGASGVFFQLQEALDRVWNVAPKQGSIKLMLKKRLFSFFAVLCMGFFVVFMLVVSAVLATLTQWESSWLPHLSLVWRGIDFGVSFAIVTLLFALVYKYIPDARITWRDVWMGAILTALLFTIGKSLLAMYFGSTSVGSIYGAAGSLVALLAWIYYSAQILLFGAEFTQVYARRFGSDITPSKRFRS